MQYYRIVQHIPITVIVLGIGGVLDKVVGGKEPSLYRVVHPSVHMDQGDLKKVFMSRIAPSQKAFVVENGI